MSGISSKSAAFGDPINKFKYNGIEFNSDFDINTYDAFYRNLDPQIGRYWQLDPKPTDFESLYAAMGNNPILYNDVLGDTAKYADDQARAMVQKFSSPTVINKKEKEVQNKNFNAAFAAIITRLDASTDNFVFRFDPNATEGLVSYDGSNVNIRIGEPGSGYGTNVGAEGILFEETKHAEQVLDGKTIFGKKSDGTWGASTNIQNEVEAKTFVSDNLHINRTYTENQSGSNFQVPTQLGYMKYDLSTNAQRATFLQQGASGLSVAGDLNRRGTINIPGAYPNLNNLPIMNTLTQRTKTNQIFGYPRR
jgi:RHS repeat-associated protein